jgi:hypothetical protein
MFQDPAPQKRKGKLTRRNGCVGVTIFAVAIKAARCW